MRLRCFLALRGHLESEQSGAGAGSELAVLEGSRAVSQGWTNQPSLLGLLQVTQRGAPGSIRVFLSLAKNSASSSSKSSSGEEEPKTWPMTISDLYILCPFSALLKAPYSSPRFSTQRFTIIPVVPNVVFIADMVPTGEFPDAHLLFSKAPLPQSKEQEVI